MIGRRGRCIIGNPMHELKQFHQPMKNSTPADFAFLHVPLVCGQPRACYAKVTKDLLAG